MARDIMAEIKATLAKNPTADVTNLVKERATKIASTSELQTQYGQSQKDLESRFIIPTTQTVQTVAEPEQNLTDMKSNLIKMEEQQKLADVARSSSQATAAVKEREALIAPQIQQAKSTSSVSTQLGQKRLKDLFAATGVAKGAAAAEQIASNQSLQSNLGALDVEEASQRSDVASDLSDIQTEKAYLEQQVRNGTASAITTQKIADIEAQQAAAIKTAEIQDERDFELYKTELNNINDQNLTILKNELDQDATVLDAQIQQARDQNLFAQEQQLVEQKAQVSAKLEAIAQSGRISLAGYNQANKLELAKVNQENDLALANTDQENALALAAEKARLSGTTGGTEDTTSTIIGGSAFALTESGEDFVNQIENGEYVNNDSGRYVDRTGIRTMLEEALEKGEVDVNTAKQVYSVYDLGGIAGPGNVINPMLLDPSLGLGVGK